jgi:hypothetical protein
MKKKDALAKKKAELLNMLQNERQINWNKLFDHMNTQHYANGSRVVFRMHEHEDSRDVPQTGIIKGYQGYTADGREIYEVKIDGSGTDLVAPIYIITATPPKEKTDAKEASENRRPRNQRED